MLHALLPVSSFYCIDKGSPVNQVFIFVTYPNMRTILVGTLVATAIAFQPVCSVPK